MDLILELFDCIEQHSIKSGIQEQLKLLYNNNSNNSNTNINNNNQYYYYDIRFNSFKHYWRISGMRLIHLIIHSHCNNNNIPIKSELYREWIIELFDRIIQKINSYYNTYKYSTDNTVLHRIVWLFYTIYILYNTQITAQLIDSHNNHNSLLLIDNNQQQYNINIVLNQSNTIMLIDLLTIFQQEYNLLDPSKLLLLLHTTGILHYSSNNYLIQEQYNYMQNSFTLNNNNINTDNNQNNQNHNLTELSNLNSIINPMELFTKSNQYKSIIKAAGISNHSNSNSNNNNSSNSTNNGTIGVFDNINNLLNSYSNYLIQRNRKFEIRSNTATAAGITDNTNNNNNNNTASINSIRNNALAHIQRKLNINTTSTDSSGNNSTSQTFPDTDTNVARLQGILAINNTARILAATHKNNNNNNNQESDNDSIQSTAAAESVSASASAIAGIALESSFNSIGLKQLNISLTAIDRQYTLATQAISITKAINTADINTDHQHSPQQYIPPQLTSNELSSASNSLELVHLANELEYKSHSVNQNRNQSILMNITDSDTSNNNLALASAAALEAVNIHLPVNQTMQQQSLQPLQQQSQPSIDSVLNAVNAANNAAANIDLLMTAFNNSTAINNPNPTTNSTTTAIKRSRGRPAKTSQIDTNKKIKTTAAAAAIHSTTNSLLLSDSALDIEYNAIQNLLVEQSRQLQSQINPNNNTVIDADTDAADIEVDEATLIQLKAELAAEAAAEAEAQAKNQ